MTATALRISDDLRLPLEAGTQTFGILGQKGSGKSTAAVVMAEEMWHAGIPWVAIDPKGDWWGIRSSADGTEPGLALPVFGGLHGDVPLEASSGAYVADLIADTNLTAVIDVSDFSKNDRARFLVAFLDRLYNRHRADPTVRHLFLEEAHEIIPQMVGREDGRLKEAATRIVLQGRTFGLGVSVCSQRSARIHKDVLTQIGTLIALRTLADLDRKAIEGWVKEHNVAKELLASLPSLKSGEAWVWSPSFLERMERIRFRPRQTFDSGATPTFGASARPPATLADVDLAAIKAAMAETIERAQADDPKLLRRRITELEKRLAARPADASAELADLQRRLSELEAELAAARAEVRTVEVPALSLDDHVRLAEALRTLTTAMEPIAAIVARPAPVRANSHSRVVPSPAATPAKPARPAKTAAVASGSEEAKLGRAERAILTVLAQHPAGRTRTQLALLTGYSIKSSSLGNALGALRSAGLVTKGGEPIQATDTGLNVATDFEDFEALPTGRALYESWAGRLGKAERAVLDVLVAAWPELLDKDEVAARTGYSATSSSLGNALGKLRSLDLVDGWAAHNDFMEAIRDAG